MAGFSQHQSRTDQRLDASRRDRYNDERLSLLTIEYDVREDQPEGTDVYELQPSSDDLIEKLLLRRVEGLSQLNAASIAKFASGNARVALALAKTIESGESVASLNDADLFERLFRQRHESSSSLLLSAQACSLPYSFQGEDLTTDQDAEISKLAAVVGKDIRALHTDIAELCRRDLIQKRGVWRALLPHAIANRLAAMALENIFPHDLEQLFATASPRLLRSISRRLGYLHTSEAAQKIVYRWLADDGLLGRTENLDEDRRAMLANVAPVDPIATLDAIERSIERRRAPTSKQADHSAAHFNSLRFHVHLCPHFGIEPMRKSVPEPGRDLRLSFYCNPPTPRPPLMPFITDGSQL